MRNGFVDNWFDADSRPFGMANKVARGGLMAPAYPASSRNCKTSQRQIGKVQRLRTVTAYMVVNKIG